MKWREKEETKGTQESVSVTSSESEEKPNKPLNLGLRYVRMHEHV